MEPVISFANKRHRDKNTEWELCIICQEVRKSDKKELKQLGERGIQRVEESVIERYNLNDVRNIEVLERLYDLQLKTAAPSGIVYYHKNCYDSFTSISHIVRLRQCIGKTSEVPLQEIQNQQDNHKLLSRRSVSLFDKTKCMFCQKNSENKITNKIMTLETSDKILKLAQTDDTMRCRLAGVSDLVAADGIYHLQCYVEFSRKCKNAITTEMPHCTQAETAESCFNTVIDELKKGLSESKVYTLYDVWSRYAELMSSNGLGVGFYRNSIAVPLLKQMCDENEDNSAMHSLKCKMGDMESELMLSLYHVAVRLRADVREISRNDNCTVINEDAVRSTIPLSLFSFVSILCGNSDDDDELRKDIETQCLSICQDIVYVASRGKVVTPKHVGLAVTVHNATRSKELVTLMHRAGHSISYDHLRRIDTSLAAEEMKRFEINKVPVPRLMSGNFFQFASDNIDILEDTLDGKNTFHATQLITFQRLPKDFTLPTESLKVGSEKKLIVNPLLHEIIFAPKNANRPSPVFFDAVNLLWFQSDKQMTQLAELKDFAWLFARSVADDAANNAQQKVPGWTAFNSRLEQGQHETTSVGFMPIINAPAHATDTLWTVIMRCLAVCKIMKQQSCVLTFDEQLYCKAKELQWTNGDVCKQLVLRMGSFHIMLNFLRVIGTHMADSGLSDVWIESKLFTDTTAASILSAKSYNRTVRAHKLTFEALWRVLLPLLLQWLTENELSKLSETIRSNVDKIISSILDVNDPQSLCPTVEHFVTDLNECSFLSCVDKFDRNKGATYTYWRQYMSMVSILLRFTRAEREGDWMLHLSAFKEMLPWFAIYDHTNYTRWGTVYLADMMLLEKTHPDIYAEFLAGNFVVKRSEGNFCQVSTDQALEHVNRTSKIAGGLIGITRIDSARDRWCLTFNERSRIVEETCQLLGLATESGDFTLPKEAGLSRTKRDDDDVKNMMCQIKRFGIFSTKHAELTCVSTNDVTTTGISSDLLSACARGQEKVNEFVTKRLVLRSVGFHDRLMQSKSSTFSTLYKAKVTKTQKKDHDIKADRTLFQRLLVAKDTGRNVDMRELLKQEFAAVPLSLATSDGKLRPTNKSLLAHILHDGLIVNCLPPPGSAKTCYIVDGQAVVRSIGKPAKAKTFGDLADIFYNRIVRHNCNAEYNRIDVVFDSYDKPSVKDDTRLKRAGQNKSIRKVIDDRNVLLSEDWDGFMSLKDNKANLADFLSNEIMAKASTHTAHVVTAGGFKNRKLAKSSLNSDVSDLMATHEEADTRLLLHAAHSCNEGYDRIVISSIDTDVLVLVLHFAKHIRAELWIEIMKDGQRAYVDVQRAELSDSIRNSLPGFHAITGCDTTSQFNGVGKKKAWKVFQQFSHLLSDLGDRFDDETFKRCEEFVCRLYKQQSTVTSVNELRFELFMQGLKQPDQLPPTQNVLKLHVLRAHHQTAVWRQSLMLEPDLPLPTDSGWYVDSCNQLHPLLMSEAVTPDSLAMIACKCSNCSTARCGCRSRNLPCFAACKCTTTLCHNPFSTTCDEEN